MILVDVNLLIYAYDESSDSHEPAKAWLEDALSGNDPVRLGWSTIHAFLRITTHAAIFDHPFSIEEAVTIVEAWLDLPNVGILEPGASYWSIFRELLRSAKVRGPLVSDAHLAALAIEHGALLCTTDRNFRRFDGLRIDNPLTAT